MVGRERSRKGYAKHFRGRFKGTSRGTEVSLGTIGLAAKEPGVIKAGVVESVRKVLSKRLKDKGKFFIKVSTDYSVTKRPLKMKMGGGAGKFEHMAAFVRSGSVILELAELEGDASREILRVVQSKIPIKTVIMYRRV